MEIAPGGSVLKTENANLTAAYRRRALYTTLGLACLALGATWPTARLLAQDTGPGAPAKQTDSGAKPAQDQTGDKKADKSKKGDTATLRIVPTPRKDSSQ